MLANTIQRKLAEAPNATGWAPNIENIENENLQVPYYEILVSGMRRANIDLRFGEEAF
jgi:hypothetical protein